MEKIDKIFSNDWYLFVDESGSENYSGIKKLRKKQGWTNYQPDPSNPTIFTLAGILIKGDELVQLINGMKNIKQKLYSDENTVFHLSDMVVGAKGFSMYRNNAQLLQQHLQLLIDRLRSINFSYYIVYVDQIGMLERYIEPVRPYQFAPRVVMERSAGYICSVLDGKCTEPPPIRVFFESRKKGKDVDLKRFMVNELKMKVPNVTIEKNFPRYPASHANIQKLEWHIHPLPKDPARIRSVKFYTSLYDTNIAENLLNGIQLADMVVTASRMYRENMFYYSPKNISKITPLYTAFVTNPIKPSYEKYIPTPMIVKTLLRQLGFLLLLLE